MWNHAWGPWWFWHCLSHGELPWRTTLLAAPRGGVLWFIDPIGGALGALLVPVIGLVGAYNAVIFTWSALASVAGRRLSLAMGAGERAAWFGGAAVAMAPFVTSEIHNGISEAVGIQWTVFALAAAREAIDHGGWRRWLVAGLWIGLSGVGTWYYGFTTALTVGAWAIFAGRARWPGLGLAAVVSAAIALPVMLLVRGSIHADDAIVARMAILPWNKNFILSHNAVDPIALIHPFDFQSVDLAATGEAFRHSSYLGLVALVLALVGRGRRLLWGVVPAVALSLGVYLWHDGHWVEWKVNGRWLLPFGVLFELLPDAGATHAQRLVLPGVVVVAALGAVGLGRLPTRLQPLLGATMLIDALWNGPWPIARAPELDLAAHRSLAGGSGIVVDLPTEVEPTMATSRYLVYQAASGRPIPYRVDARGSTATFLGRDWWALLRAQCLAGDPGLQMDQAARLSGKATLAEVERSGVTAFVLHPELDRGTGSVPKLDAVLRGWLGEPTVIGGHSVWTVP